MKAKVIPKYAKFFKDIVANKSKLAGFETVTLIEECSSRILNKVKLLAKQKDLGLGELNSTTILLQLVDRSVARPDGIIEDFEPDPEVSFILGHPFLEKSGALIDVDTGILTMAAHDKVEVFDVYQALKLPAVYKELSVITGIDEEVSAQCILAKDPLEKVVMGQHIEEDTEAKELASVLDMPNVSIWKKNVEPLNRELGPLPKPSLEEAPNLELKQLPTHLRLAGQEYYCFLDGYSGYNHTITSEDQEKTRLPLTFQSLEIPLIPVDKAKIEVIENLPPPISVNGVRSFLGHAGFYWLFIKDFSKIARPMCSLLEKEAKFIFDDKCLQSFELLKKKLIEVPILIAPN
ncbi:uncharacterized protein LOC129894705 [Solanum dulcamara]|uniref:uncharacterized protein LOC129894705 n=1 Tax=Solanum dulcamara TaxID=45834 RepID=UPI002485EC2F|nr:uncharacterized protein LOC129894705 [Solanum dulcamara]